LARALKVGSRGTDLKLFEMPVDQFNGVHLLLATFVSIVPTDSTKQYEDYIARLNHVPGLFDKLIDVLKQGEKDKLMPPRFLLEKVVKQCQSIAEPAGEASVFAQPVTKFADSVPETDRKRLHDAVIAAVDGKVRPAYRKLADFVAKDYAPKGRTQPGLWALPNGDALYRFDVEQQTTTNKPAEEIHQLGLAAVARIEGEQAKIATQLGYSDLASLRADSTRTRRRTRPRASRLWTCIKSTSRRCSRSCRSCSACCPRPTSRCCRSRSSARRKPAARSTTRARRTASARAASTSTPATGPTAPC
jgi:uncharacterized protein (DUF885 family)